SSLLLTMVILRNGSNTKGATAPSYGSNKHTTTQMARVSTLEGENNHTGATGEADRQAVRCNDQENRRAMPGEFSYSPISPRLEPPEQSGKQEEVWASNRVAGPAKKSIGEARGDPSQPYNLEGRASKQAPRPSEPHPSRASTSKRASQPSKTYPSRLITPSFLANAKATPREEDPVGSTTPFVTPSQKARPPVTTQCVPLNGPKFFTEIINVDTGSIHEEVKEPKNGSNKTLRQSKVLKRKSAAQQKVKDLAYMREIIKDNQRLRSLQSLLPNIIQNDKDLLTKINKVLRESSSTKEYTPSEWEIELETNSPNAETRTTAQPSNQSAAMGPSHPTFFDKGKWISNKDFDVQQAYKAAKSRTDDTMPKKDQPSIGITLDDIRPPRKAARQETRERSCDRLGIAALPAGGYC
ncbi:hypothetical protein RHS02_06468, partial [Rhizoctonia solani]